MLEYQIVAAYGGDNQREYQAAISQLEEQVREAISDGWKPLGGLSLAESNTASILAQAMIRDS